MSSGHCITSGCRGDRAQNGACVIHGPLNSWKAFLGRVHDGQPIDDLRGCVVSGARFCEVIDSLPIRHEALAIRDGDFTNTTFLDDVSFRNVAFSGATQFEGAVFAGALLFEKVAAESIKFVDVSVAKDASFLGIACSDDFTVASLRVNGSVAIQGMLCAQGTYIDALNCAGNITLVRSAFSGRADWGTVEAHEILCAAEFSARLSATVSVRNLCLSGSRFNQGLSLTVISGRVNLAGAVLAAESRITGDANSTQAAVVSVDDVDAAKLTLDNVDLSECCLGRAHDVEDIVLDNVRFGQPERWWHTSRAVIAEEHLWRTKRSVQPPLKPDESPGAGSVARVYRLMRKAIETSKGEPGGADFYFGEMEMQRTQRLHDLVRRQTQGRGSRLAALLDYLLFSVYWAISGYGLRVGRSLTAFVALVGACACALAAWGYPAPKSAYVPVGTSPRGFVQYSLEIPHENSFVEDLPRALRLAVQSSVSLLQTPAQALTSTGEWVVLLLRFAGPLVLGLTILAVHNKLRR